MVTAIYGQRRQCRINKDDPALDKAQFKCIILGSQSFYEAKRQGMLDEFTPGDVCVFTSSPLTALAIARQGYVNVHCVNSISEVSADDILDASDFKDTMMEQVLLAYTCDSLTETLTQLMASLETMDIEGFAEVFLHQGNKLRSDISRLREVKLAQERIVSRTTVVAESSTDSAKYAELTQKFEQAEADWTAERVRLQGEVQTLTDLVEQVKSEASDINTSAFAEEVTKLRKQLKQSGEKYEELVGEFQSRFAQTQSEVRAAEARAQTAIDEKNVLQAKFDTLSSKSQDLVNTYNALVEAYKKRGEELTQVQADLQIANKRVAVREADNGETAQQAIESLKAELEAAKSGGILGVQNQMPIIGPKFAIRASKLLLIKEIRPCLYMPAFLEALQRIYCNRIKTVSNKTVAFIVLDLMIDQFRMAQYRKHHYAINAPAITTAGGTNLVSVVNKFDTTFLKDTLNLNNFDYLVIIDRLGLREPAVKHTSLTTAFMVDSGNDLMEFSLKNTPIIMFSEAPVGEYILNVPPADMSGPFDDQLYQLFKLKLVEKLYQRAGIS